MRLTDPLNKSTPVDKYANQQDSESCFILMLRLTLKMESCNLSSRFLSRLIIVSTTAQKFCRKMMMLKNRDDWLQLSILSINLSIKSKHSSESCWVAYLSTGVDLLSVFVKLMILCKTSWGHQSFLTYWAKSNLSLYCFWKWHLNSWSCPPLHHLIILIHWYCTWW